MRITDKNMEILAFIKSYWKENYSSPTVYDIRDHFKMASLSSAHGHVRRLREAGYLKGVKKRHSVVPADMVVTFSSKEALKRAGVKI